MFKIEKIINYYTIEVSPKWVWNDLSSNKVNITGFHNKEADDVLYLASFVENKLNFLLLNKYVELKNPQDMGEDGSMSIYLNDINIKLYFPELFKDKGSEKTSFWTKVKNFLQK